jgi:hypothetical protein
MYPIQAQRNIEIPKKVAGLDLPLLIIATGVIAYLLTRPSGKHGR